MPWVFLPARWGGGPTGPEGSGATVTEVQPPPPLRGHLQRYAQRRRPAVRQESGPHEHRLESNASAALSRRRAVTSPGCPWLWRVRSLKLSVGAPELDLRTQAGAPPERCRRGLREAAEATRESCVPCHRDRRARYEASPTLVRYVAIGERIARIARSRWSCRGRQMHTRNRPARREVRDGSLPRDALREKRRCASRGRHSFSRKRPVSKSKISDGSDGEAPPRPRPAPSEGDQRMARALGFASRE